MNLNDPIVISQGRCFDPLRKFWVKATPEEIVRQKLIYNLVNTLGFPPALLAVENELSQLPHLQTDIINIPQRRLDLICYGKDIHPQYSLYPLMMVECKAIKIHAKALRQLIGYNFYVRAYFLALAGRDEVKFGWFDKTKDDYQFINYIPRYVDLCELLKGAL